MLVVDHGMTEIRLTFLSLSTEPKKCVVRILPEEMHETADRQKMTHLTDFAGADE